MGLCYEGEGGDNLTAVLAASAKTTCCPASARPCPTLRCAPPPYFLSPLPHPECSSRELYSGCIIPSHQG